MPLGFTFDAPISASSSAYDKVNQHHFRGTPLPSRPKPKTSLIGSFRKIFNKANSPSQDLITTTIRPSPNAELPLFRISVEVRKRIYGYVLGEDEVLHVLLKRKVARSGFCVGYRRCRARGNGESSEDCILSHCKEGLDVATGVYSGSFDTILPLLLSCRDTYEEASELLYSQNTFDFDHPLSLLLFTQQLSPSSHQNIRSISLDIRDYLYDSKTKRRCKSFHESQWEGCWEVIARMEGLESVIVTFRSPIQGWLGLSREEVLEPLEKVGTVGGETLKVFEKLES